MADSSPHSAPRLSVVVVALNRSALLHRCLEALTSPTNASPDVEILVAGDWQTDGTGLASLRSAFPAVTWVDAPESTVPQRRTRGITAARGETVALLEDDCVVSDGWCEAVLHAHDTPSPAIGGAVEPGPYQTALDWAIYFCEYARFMRPFAGAVDALPGNHVSYKRSALHLEAAGDAPPGFYETAFHTRLRHSGTTLLADPALVVVNINSWRPRAALRDPFHHGRTFAGMRVVGHSVIRRLAFAGLALVLPLIRVFRVVRDVSGRGRYGATLVRALPWILVFSSAWSLGELVGYLFGPGTSPTRWS